MSIKVLTLVGSLRNGSINRQLAEAAATVAPGPCPSTASCSGCV